jgi:hypothetical protein
VRQSGAGGGEHALDVDVDHPLPVLGVRADDGPQEHQPGVVDQGVQPPEPRDGLLHGALRLRAVGDVGGHHQRAPARLVDLGGEGLQTVLATGHEHDGGAVRGEPRSGGSANPAASPRDDGNGSSKCRLHDDSFSLSLSLSLGKGGKPIAELGGLRRTRTLHRVRVRRRPPSSCAREPALADRADDPLPGLLLDVSAALCAAKVHQNDAFTALWLH